MLFELILKAEQSDKYSEEFQDLLVEKKKCIYCLTDNGSFSSEEHILPESLGNEEWILPKGYVCDKCNNNILSNLDNKFIQFAPISFLQLQFVNYTKAGKLPTARFQNAVIKKTRPRELKILPQENVDPMKITKLDDGRFHFSVSVKGRKIAFKDVGRALYKIALGFVALEYGIEAACDPKFDQARRFVITGESPPNALLIRKRGAPKPGITVEFKTLKPEGMVFLLDIYGLIFFLNLEDTPRIQSHEILIQQDYELVMLDEEPNSDVTD